MILDLAILLPRPPFPHESAFLQMHFTLSEADFEEGEKKDAKSCGKLSKDELKAQATSSSHERHSSPAAGVGSFAEARGSTCQVLGSQKHLERGGNFSLNELRSQMRASSSRIKVGGYVFFEPLSLIRIP